MGMLSRTDEMILLAVWRLEDNAYGVTIAEMLIQTSEKKWVLGAVYVPLERLEKKGYLFSYLGKSTKKRGGRSKRLYKLTKYGVDALIKTKNQEQSIWANITISSLEKGYDT
ncbi:MAG: helix-turn-helix transcriptional regulator [Candidatus Aminicenantes bacterium]|nr:MAG: helix-turn-helix transcriptional regulator [Candidatus Aminicenantes bacterium]